MCLDIAIDMNEILNTVRGDKSDADIDIGGERKVMQIKII